MIKSKITKSILRISITVVSIVFLFYLSLLLFVVRPIISEKSSIEYDCDISVENLKDHVHKMTESYYPRNYTNIENLNKAADYIYNNFSNYSDSVYFQDFSIGFKDYKNVVSYLNNDSDETMIIGAHYDSYDLTYGADDNASGVSAVIELNRILSSKKLNYNIKLIGFTLEEPPYFKTEFMGSNVDAKLTKKNNENIKLLICFDMIGYYIETENSQNYPSKIFDCLYPSTTNFIAVIENFDSSYAKEIKRAILTSTDLPAISVNLFSSIPGIDFSDHRNYWDKGINAVMISDMAFYRNENYHKLNDKKESLNYDNIGKVIRGVTYFLEEGLNETPNKGIVAYSRVVS